MIRSCFLRCEYVRKRIVCQPKIGHLMLWRVNRKIHCRSIKMRIRRGNEVKFMKKDCFLENLDANFLYALKDDSGTIGDNNRWAVAVNTNHRR